MGGAGARAGVVGRSCLVFEAGIARHVEYRNPNCARLSSTGTFHPGVKKGNIICVMFMYHGNCMKEHIHNVHNIIIQALIWHTITITVYMYGGCTTKLMCIHTCMYMYMACSNYTCNVIIFEHALIMQSLHTKNVI